MRSRPMDSRKIAARVRLGEPTLESPRMTGGPSPRLRRLLSGVALAILAAVAVEQLELTPSYPHDAHADADAGRAGAHPDLRTAPGVGGLAPARRLGPVGKEPGSLDAFQSRRAVSWRLSSSRSEHDTWRATPQSRMTRSWPRSMRRSLPAAGSWRPFRRSGGRFHGP